MRFTDRRARVPVLSVVILVTLLGVRADASSRPLRVRGTRGDATIPVVAIDTPAAGVTVSSSVLVAGTASDTGGVRKVEVLVEGSISRATGTTSWSYLLDTTRFSDGAHVLMARAMDQSGNRGTRTITIIVLNGSPSPSPSPSPGPPAGTAPVVLGVWSDGNGGHTTEALEAQIGRMFGGSRFNHSLMNPIPGNTDDKNFDAGRTVVYRNAQSEDLSDAPVLWADVAAGKYDWRLAEIADAVRADTRWTRATPFLFSFHHEQDATSGFGTPEDYKAAFRHVFDYFESAGILWRYGGQVEMVWTLTRSSLNSDTAASYDPDLAADGVTLVGDYYDVLGLDVYDKLQTDGRLGYTDPRTAFDPAHEYALARGKQFGIFEFGVSEGAPGEKAAVFSQLAPTLRSYGVGVPGSAMALMYSNVTGKQPYYPDTSPDALAAFTAMANDPLFTG
jgi:hypothetical protein